MRNLTVIFAVKILLLSISVSAQKYDWAVSLGGKSVDEGASVCMDAEGNSYIAGSFSSRPFEIGSFSLMNTSNTFNKWKMFVAKLDGSGKVVWAIQSKGLGDERAVDVACDKTGHIIVVGKFTGKKATFGSKEITNPRENSRSVFILRVNNLGNIHWVKNETGSADVKDVTTGPDGEFFITGTSNLRAKFTDREKGPGNQNVPTAFIAKYKHNGFLEWIHHIHGTSGGGQRSSQSGEAIFATNDSRFVYVAGWFRGKVTFGEASTITSNDFRNPKVFGGQRNFFVSKLHADDAREVWTTSVGVTQLNFSSPPEISDIVVDHQGSSFITGSFPSVLKFGETELQATPSRNKNTYNYDIFLAKFHQDGSPLWQKGIGGTERDMSNSIALTGKGVLITGMVSGMAKFGNLAQSGSGIAGMFAAEYDTNGNALWVKGNKSGFAGVNQSHGIATDGKTAVVIGNYTGNLIGFDEIKLNQIGTMNIFVAKMQ
ncbi:MAG: hypothetical protein R2681_17735 [Pyrinomonadaceae bacterium]